MTFLHTLKMTLISFYDTELVQLLQQDADLTLEKAKKQNSKFSKEWRK